MTRKSRIEPRKNLSFLSENDFGPKILPNAKNRQISRTGKAESFWETFVEIRLLHSDHLPVSQACAIREFLL